MRRMGGYLAVMRAALPERGRAYRRLPSDVRRGNPVGGRAGTSTYLPARLQERANAVLGAAMMARSPLISTGCG